jgi:hypothetical protein
LPHNSQTFKMHILISLFKHIKLNIEISTTHSIPSKQISNKCVATIDAY